MLFFPSSSIIRSTFADRKIMTDKDSTDQNNNKQEDLDDKNETYENESEQSNQSSFKTRTYH